MKRSPLDSFTWPSLRRVGSSKAIKSSAIWLFLIPPAAKALQYLPEKLSFTIGSKTFEIIARLPFSWYLLFFAAISFAIASFLYYVFCPVFVRRFPTFESFTHEGHGQLSLNEGLIECSKLSGEGNTFDYKDFLSRYSVDTETIHRYMKTITIGGINTASPSSSSSKSQLLTDRDIADVFWAIQRHSAGFRRWCLLLASIAYGAGFLMLSIIAMQNLAWVFRSLF